MEDQMKQQQQAKFQVISTVVCDDQLQLANGKQILVGVYGEGAMVAAFPAKFSPMIRVDFLAEIGGSADSGIRVLDANGKELCAAGATFENLGPVSLKYLTLAVRLPEIIVQAAGPLQLVFGLDETEVPVRVFQFSSKAPGGAPLSPSSRVH
jgi:hypothetical protein